MSSMPASRQRLAQIAHQSPRHHCGQHGTKNYAPLRSAISGGLKVEPADHPDHVVSNLKVDAFAKGALDNLGLGQWCGRDHLSHISSPNGVLS